LLNLPFCSTVDWKGCPRFFPVTVESAFLALLSLATKLSSTIVLKGKEQPVRILTSN